MSTVNYTIRLDESDKQAAEQVFSQLGLTLAAGLNVYLKAVVRQQRIPFELALSGQTATKLGSAGATITRREKEKSFNVLNGILAGYEIDLHKEREERVLSK
jgi:DNA-damage-inducible protein J